MRDAEADLRGKNSSHRTSPKLGCTFPGEPNALPTAAGNNSTNHAMMKVARSRACSFFFLQRAQGHVCLLSKMHP